MITITKRIANVLTVCFIVVYILFFTIHTFNYEHFLFFYIDVFKTEFIKKTLFNR